MKEGFIYIASPYSHPETLVMSQRYYDVMDYVVGLLRENKWCYSPIVHCHEMANTHHLPTDAAFWKDYNYTMMRAASGLHVLMLDGWRQSVGVADEIAWWERERPETSLKFVAP